MQHFSQLKNSIKEFWKTRVIFNFTNSTEVEKHTQELEQYVVPHFKKMMPKSGMVGWGLSSKITLQGDDFATMMVYDSYDSLENAMIHLSGGGAIAGLPHEKFLPSNGLCVHC
ncbi:hypothetical protein N9R22_02705 [Flavobacteriaceae bacterium]|nr:hypothetical protein [Flavobacteriaceae bacterium]